MQATLEDDGLYLAFDSDCGTCKGISARVQESAKGRIVAVPLSDPSVEAARNKIYGLEAPHKPTLLRVRQGDVQAWTGPAMGWILTKELGASDTLAIVQALGVERQSGHRALVRPAVEKRVSRRRFGQIAGGLAASVSIFATGNLSSAAFAEGADGDDGRERALSDTEAQSLLDAALSSIDLRNIAPRGAVQRLSGGEVLEHDAIPAPGRFIETSKDGSTDLGDGIVVPGTGVLAVFSSKSFKDGTRSQTVAIALSTSELLTYVTEQVGNKSASGAERYEMDPEHGELVIAEVAAGGQVSEPVPDGAITANGSDPCGGCAQANMQLSSACKSTEPVECALLGSGCVACKSSCLVINAGCIACVVAACGSALKKCCDNGSVEVCKPCKIMP